MSTGFSRERPVLVIDETAPAARTPTAEPAAESVPVPTDRAGQLAAVASEVAQCVKCGLCNGRTTTVPGEGPLDPPVMFIGEGPGEAEDKSGRPFVGAAGQYLDKWIPAIGLRRQDCFIANIVKCRPPSNREPHPEEISACLPYLERQILATRPKTICCLGRIAAHVLLQTTASLGALRGKTHRWRDVPLVVTYHPSAVLRDNLLRKPVWEDLKLLKTLLPGQATEAAGR